MGYSMKGLIAELMVQTPNLAIPIAAMTGRGALFCQNNVDIPEQRNVRPSFLPS